MQPLSQLASTYNFLSRSVRETDVACYLGVKLHFVVSNTPRQAQAQSTTSYNVFSVKSSPPRFVLLSWLLNAPASDTACLREETAYRVLCAATLRRKLQIELAFSSFHRVSTKSKRWPDNNRRLTGLPPTVDFYVTDVIRPGRQPRAFRTRGGHINSKLERYGFFVVGCLTSKQHASVSQGRICSDNCTCCHTEIEVADQTFHLTQSQYTGTGPTSPSADPLTPGAW